MAYEPTEWTNREVEKPRTYIMTDNGDGTITLTPSEGQVFAPGTPLDASNLNKIEQQLASNTDNIETRISKFGDVMTGTFTGTTINAQTALQQGGINLDNKYQAKGSYQSTGQYVTWNADPNGVYITCGVSNGKTYRIYLTSAQPWDGDASDRHVWVQTDA